MKLTTPATSFSTQEAWITDKAFPPNSMKKHVAAFKEQGANYSIVKNSNIAFDVDTNEDVESLKTLSEKSPTVISILNLIN